MSAHDANEEYTVRSHAVASSLVQRVDKPYGMASGKVGNAAGAGAGAEPTPLARAFMEDYEETLDWPSRNSSAGSGFNVPVFKPDPLPAVDRRVDAAALAESLRHIPVIQHGAFPSNRLHPPPCPPVTITGERGKSDERTVASAAGVLLSVRKIILRRSRVRERAFS